MSSQTQLVSIIIPVKNRGSLLFDTLNNICNQSYTNIEILVIDDHSKEDIKHVIDKISDRRIIYLKNKGAGPGAARNTGLEVTRGEYVKYFDSDDLMTNNLIEDQLNHLIQTKSDAVYSPYVKVRSGNTGYQQVGEVMHYKPWTQSRHLTDLMLAGFFIPIPAFLFKRSFLKTSPKWPQGFITYEDWLYLWNIALLKPKIIHSNAGCFFYVIHGEQSTGDNLTDEQRDEEKSKLMIPLLSERYFDKSISSLDKLRSGARLFKEVNGLSSKKIIVQYKGLLKSKRLKIIDFVWRAYQKMHSITRSSKWPKYYGAVNGSGVYKKFLNRVK